MKSLNFKSLYLFILLLVAGNISAQAILNPAIYSLAPGGARILSTRGDTPANPAIGFSGAGVLPGNLNDGGGGNGIFRPAANAMAFSTASLERMRITPSGLVGIGITAPTYKLDVLGTAAASNPIARFADSENRSIIFVPKLVTGGYTFASQVNDAGIFWSDNGGGWNKTAGFVIAPQKGIWGGIRLDDDGSANLPGYTTTVGVGISKLGLGTAYALASGWGTSYVGFNAARKAGAWTFDGDGANNGGNAIYGDVGGTMRFVTKLSTGGANETLSDNDILTRTKMMIKGDGSVVVGNVTTPSGYKLYVETGILTEKVKVAVKNTIDWADYVFADDYNLRPLEEVAEFVKKEKHLPGVPSAEAMVNEGLDVAKMDAKLLEKIEELTLYMLQLDRDNKVLRQEVEALKNKK